MMKLIVILLLAAVGANSEIFGRKEATDNEFQYHVGLRMSEPTIEQYCGGSLISQTFIITAAQCIHMCEPTNITAYLGSKHIFQGEQRTGLKKFIHPGWKSSSFENDIALLEIESISYSDTIQKVNLPSLSNVNLSYEAHVAISAGWGMRNTTNDTSIRLQFTHFLVISNSACSKAKLLGGNLTENMICGGDSDGSTTWGGDSGAALVEEGNHTLIGIVAYVESSEELHFGTVFTRVTSFREWIYNQAGI